MKKFALTLTAILAAAALAGCTSAPSSSSAPSSVPSSSAPSSAPASQAASGSTAAGVTMASSLTEIMDAVLAGAPADQLPMLLPADLNGGEKYAPLTEENSEYNLGVARDRYADGIDAEAAMSSVPFSVCLVQANSADEAEQLAADIEANANPRKWVCVEAESKIVDRSGDKVILIMASTDLANQLHAAFTALAQ